MNLNESCVFFPKICPLTECQDPTLNGASVLPISQIRTAVISVSFKTRS